MGLKNGRDRSAYLCSFVEKQIPDVARSRVFSFADWFGLPIKAFSPPRASSSANSFRRRRTDLAGNARRGQANESSAVSGSVAFSRVRIRPARPVNGASEIRFEA
jgi:hypothetical protein